MVLVCNAANAIFCAWPRLAGTQVALNVDGLERKRKKWNAFGRAWYLASERLSTWFPNAIVTDAEVIEDYYRERYGAASTFIPYGCHVGRDAGRTTLDRLGLEADSYFLYVSRLEPENNALAVIAAYEQTSLAPRLVVVGDAPYAREYIATLHAAAGPRVLFTGGIYGDGYRELQCHALAYVHATEVGGTHPALVESMGFGNCMLVHDDAREPRSGRRRGAVLRRASSRDAGRAARSGRRRSGARRRLPRPRHGACRARFSWDRVTDQYEAILFRSSRTRPIARQMSMAVPH